VEGEVDLIKKQPKQPSPDSEPVVPPVVVERNNEPPPGVERSNNQLTTFVPFVLIIMKTQIIILSCFSSGTSSRYDTTTDT